MTMQPLPIFAGFTAIALCFWLPVPSAAAETPTPAQKSFATAEEAAQALLAAADANDITTLYLLFGPDGKEIVSSGDPIQDQNRRAVFAQQGKQSLKLQKDSPNRGHVQLLIGTDDYPFAVPLVKIHGQWQFDTQQGKRELLARRVGSNELDAIALCAAYVDAQFEYASENHDHTEVRQYAQKFISSEGKTNGLYWPASSDAAPSPIAEMVTQAEAEGYSTQQPGVPYHGYYFRILTGQGPHATGGAQSYVAHGLMIGGFGLIAWPAEYGASGVKAFMVNQDGVVYERDFGPDTSAAVRVITTFDPDKTWRVTK
jgi:hypothetical protein